jgi:hypothetical protein
MAIPIMESYLAGVEPNGDRARLESMSIFNPLREFRPSSLKPLNELVSSLDILPSSHPPSQPSRIPHLNAAHLDDEAADNVDSLSKAIAMRTRMISAEGALSNVKAVNSAPLGNRMSPYLSCNRTKVRPYEVLLDVQLEPTTNTLRDYLKINKPLLPILPIEVKVLPLAITSKSSQTESCKEFTSVKIKNLSKLFNLLTKMFVKDDDLVPTDVELIPVERLLFLELLRRKFSSLPVPRFEMDQHQNQILIGLIEQARVQKAAKRIEERKKFIFKHVLKNLKKEFFESTLFKSTHQDKGLFYHYYFDEIAERRKYSIESFHDPLNFQTGDRVYKTLSNIYLALLFESRRFQNDFLLYMTSTSLLSDYRELVPKKIEKLLLKWERMLSGKICQEKIIQSIRAFFSSNKQCKLPWTSEEINHAAMSFLKFTQVDR